MAKLTHEQIYEDNLWLNYIQGIETAIDKTELLKSILKETATASAKTASETTAKDFESINKKTEALKTGLKSVEDYNKALKAQKEAEQELAKAVKQAQDEQFKSIAEKKEAIKIAQLEEKINRSLEGSYDKLSAQYSLNKIQLNKMSAEMRETTEEGKKLEAETAMLYREMDKAKGSIGKYALGIGSAGKSIDATSGNLKEMRVELRKLQSISFVGKSKEEVDALKQQMGSLIDQIGDLTTELNAIGEDNFPSILTGLTLVSAGVEGVVSSLSLLGVESDSIKVLEQKMLQMMALVQALTTIEQAYSTGKIRAIKIKLQDMALTVKDSVLKWSNSVATVAQTRAENAKSVALGKGNALVKTAAYVQWAWNAALAANPIVLVASGVVALGAAIGILIYKMSSGVDETERLNDELIKLRANTDSINRATKERMELMKITGKSNVEIIEAEIIAQKEQYEQSQKELKLLYELQRIDGDDEDRKSRINELIQLQNDLIDENVITKVRLAKAIEEENKKSKEQQEDERKKSEERLRQLRLYKLEYQKYLREISAEKSKESLDSQKEILEKEKYSNKASIQEYEKYIVEYFAKLKYVAEKEREIALNQKDLTKYQKLLIDAEYVEKLRDINNAERKDKKDLNKSIVDADKEKNDAILEAQKNLSKQRRDIEVENKQEVIDSKKDELKDIEINNQKDIDLFNSKTKEINSLIDERTKKQIESIEKERDLELEKEKIEENRIAITEKATNDIQNLESEALKEKEDLNKQIEQNITDFQKKQKDERVKLLNETAQAIDDFYTAKYEKQKKDIEKEISLSEKRENELRDLAQKGVENATENLAFEQQKQAELALKKERIERKQKNLELTMTALETYSKKVEAGDENAVGSTIKDITVLTAFMKSLSSYFVGTEDTGVGGEVDSKGGFLSVLHPHERVLTADQNKLVSGLSNWELAMAGKEYKENKFFGLENKIDKLISVIDEKPVYLGRDYSATESAIIDKIQKGSTTIKNHIKIS